MDSYYNSQFLCNLLRENGFNVAGTLLLNRKHVIQLVKSVKLAKSESAAAECNEIMVMKWGDGRSVIYIHV